MKKFYALCSVFFLTATLLRAQDYQVNGSATPIAGSDQCFQLTPPILFHQAGSVWSTTPIDLTKNFVVNTRLYFGVQDNGADGLAFVFQNAGLNALGISGGGIGYHGIAGNSFIIEFDTYQNLQGNFFTGDPVEDHIGFMSQGNAFHNQPSALAPPIPLSQNIEDDQYHDARFSWDASARVMTLSFLGQTFTYSGDIVTSIFGGNPVVYWGFTAATGSDISLSGATQSEHRVCILPPPTCGQLRTQTPGGWGAVPNGNNPGTYLHQHFATAFPSGLVVGDAGAGKFVRFTTASAITDYLPAGGPSKVLTASYLNPQTNDLKNTLVSQLVSVTLAVGFDQTDPSFGAAGVQLGDMIIKSGAFANKTVSFFLAEANKVLAGTSNAYTLQQVLDVATAINENYDNGSVDKGFLVCPGSVSTARTAPVSLLPNLKLSNTDGLSVQPNPSSGRFTISSGLEGTVRLQVLSANGIAIQERTLQVNKGQLIGVDMTRQPQGIYLVRLRSGNAVQTQKLVLQK